jgi:hypothetical protein
MKEERSDWNKWIDELKGDWEVEEEIIVEGGKAQRVTRLRPKDK